MNVDVSSEIVINCSLENVSTYAANPDNAPARYANIQSVEWKPPLPLRIGSQIAFVAHFLRRRIATPTKIVELIHGERLIIAKGGGAISDGDHLHRGNSRERQHSNDTAKSQKLQPGFPNYLHPSWEWRCATLI